MAGGSLQKGGLIYQVTGALEIVVGALLTATGIGAPIGAVLMQAGFASLTAGTVLSVAGGFITPIRPDSGNTRRDSPTYGFGGAQYANRVKGDAPIPVQYASRIKVAPIIAQVFTTPRGLENLDEFARTSPSPGQAISMQLVGGEGPIERIESLQINGEPLFDLVGDDDPNDPSTPVTKFLATGPGGSSAYTLDLGKRVYLPSLDIRVNGTRKLWVPTQRTSTFTGDGSRTTWKVIAAATDLDLCAEYSLVFKVNGSIVDTDDTAAVRPYAWLDGTGDARTLWIDTGVPMPSGTRLDVLYWARVAADGITVSTSNGKTTLRWPPGNAPTAGTKITGRYLRYRTPGVSIQMRYGGEHQLPLDGFQSTRQTQSALAEITKTSATQRSTTSEVDDVVLDFASSAQGMRSIDSTDGGSGPVEAIVRIRYKPYNAAASQWVTLDDPRGASTAFRDNKPADSFAFHDESSAQRFWSLSIRGILRQLAADKPNSSWPGRLANFTRQRYDFDVIRLNPARYASNGTGDLFFDEIDLLSWQEVQDEWLTHGGTWQIGLHGYASAKLNGQLPNLTAVVAGRTSIGYAYASTDINLVTTYPWARADLISSTVAETNPVWCACDLIVNKRYGGGAQYTHDNIDSESAYLAAQWCDATISRDGGAATEVRARLDYSADTRQSLMACVAEMLAPAHVIPVLQGDTWRFVIDQAVTLADCLTFYDDGNGESNDTSPGATMSHEPVTSDVTELYVDFFDETAGWTRQQAVVAPSTPAESRRVKRIEIKGCTRPTQAKRYAQRVYAAATASPSIPGAILTLHARGLPLEAGDVIRFVSQRLAFDGYLRIVAMGFDAVKVPEVKLECIEYRPEVYGQQSTHARIIANPNVTARPAVTNLGAMAATVRLVA